MIKYRKIDKDDILWDDLKSKEPLVYYCNDLEVVYTIPYPYRKHVYGGYVYHREDGPAIQKRNGEIFYIWYDHQAHTKQEWLDPNWRKKIEMNLFL